MAKIELTRGKVALIDDEDFARVSLYRWVAMYRRWKAQGKWRTRIYAVHYYKEGGKFKTLPLHRLILQAEAGFDVDHKNGNTLDNRRNNLRACTRSQNRANQRLTCGTSRYKGVSWKSNKRRWRATIRINGKGIHLGQFRSERDAALAYNKMAIKSFGEYAALNKIS